VRTKITAPRAVWEVRDFLLKPFCFAAVATPPSHCLLQSKFRCSHRGGPGSRTGLVKWDLWWTKWRWGRFSPSNSVSLASLNSTNCSIITLIYHLGLYNRPEVAAVPGDVSPTSPKKKVQMFPPCPHGSDRVSTPGTFDTDHQSHTQSQSYFTTGGLPSVSSSWRQAP
jgi:hypothetical protein